MANCKNCGREYEAKRSTSEYCGSKCKQEFYRNRFHSVTLKESQAVTLTKKDITDGSMNIETLAKVDAGCGDKLSHGLKRGKGIKCFADLPPDVQATIDKLSESNEEKHKRTQIAVQYQHTFPDRFHSTGAAI